MSSQERSAWAKDVLVFFNTCATVDEEFMLKKYIPAIRGALCMHLFCERRVVKTPGLLVYDSCNSHLTQAVKESFIKEGVALAVIPKVYPT